MERRRLNPTFTRTEQLLIALAALSLLGQFLLNRGSDPSDAARIGAVVLGFAFFAFCIAMAISVLRRARAHGD